MVAHQSPAAGAAAQIALLAALWAWVGLGSAGWLAGIAYAVVVGVLLTRALHREGMRSLGPANRVTQTRAILVGGVTALTADGIAGGTPLAVFVALTAVALALDALDGHVARRTRTESALGARFDMEVDAFLILVLCVFVAESLGAWVLAIGAMRYAFAVAGWAAPWLQSPLPPSFARKTVAALQGIILAVASAGVLPRPAAIALVGFALASLVWSFGRDVVWLWRRSGQPAHSASSRGRYRGPLHSWTQRGEYKRCVTTPSRTKTSPRVIW